MSNRELLRGTGNGNRQQHPMGHARLTAFPASAQTSVPPRGI